MFDQDLSKFAMLLTGVGEVYDKSFTPAVIEAYWNVLKDFEFEDVKKAVYLHLKNPDAGKYLPKPADIIMTIKGSPQDQALRAWTKVVSAVQSIGIYTSVAFDDPLIHAVIEDMNGWQRLGIVKDTQLPFVGKEFQERYRGYVINKPIRYPRYLVGMMESRNSVYGHTHDPPILIGDKEKADRVVIAGSPISILGNNMNDETMFLEGVQDKCKKSSVLRSVLKTT